MRTYELVVVAKTAADTKKLADTVKGWLGKVKVAKEDDWGQKPLAYEIKHQSAGHYYFMQLETEEGIPTDLETKIFRHEDVLRHLLLRTN